MIPESDRPWWSWAPNFPKPAIIAIALAVDLIIGGTWFYGIFMRGEATFSNPSPVGDVIINVNPMANVATALALIQLNLEVIYMILTKRRNLYEKEQAVAKAKAEAEVRAKAEGIAEGKAEGIAQGKAAGIAQGKAAGIAQGKAAAEAAAAARIREWYEAHRHDLANAPPPPYSNGYQNGAGQTDSPSQE